MTAGGSRNWLIEIASARSGPIAEQNSSFACKLFKGYRDE